MKIEQERKKQENVAMTNLQKRDIYYGNYRLGLKNLPDHQLRH